MFNLKSALALVLVSAISINVSANVLVDEIVIDTTDLQSSINADLTAAMDKMQQEELQPPTMLIAEEGKAPSLQVVKAEQ